MTTEPAKVRTDYLSTIDMYNLDSACRLIARALGHPYLVGSCAEARPYRDVDVRLILDDAVFDGLCGDLQVWALLSVAIGDSLRQRTGLPIDFQIQRQTEANAKHAGKVRNPLGMDRDFAGGGDGTPPWRSTE